VGAAPRPRFGRACSTSKLNRVALSLLIDITEVHVLGLSESHGVIDMVISINDKSHCHAFILLSKYPQERHPQPHRRPNPNPDPKPNPNPNPQPHRRLEDIIPIRVRVRVRVRVRT